MDTSSKYIKMCEKANKYIFPNGCNLINEDYLYCEKTTRKLKPGWRILNKFRLKGYLDTRDMISNYFIIWKQDSLQEMCKFSENDVLLKTFYEWAYEHWGRICPDLPDRNKGESFEMMWLAFYMWLKYGKEWNDKKQQWA